MAPRMINRLRRIWSKGLELDIPYSEAEEISTEEIEEPTLASLSTTPGLYHALMPWKIWVKVLWLLSFLGCVAACIYCVILVITNYFSYGKDVQMKLQSDNLRFPAVTVCSQNPYSTSGMMTNGVLEFQALMSLYVRLKQRPEEPPNDFIPSEWPPPRYSVQCDFREEVPNGDIIYTDVTRQPGAVAKLICFSGFILDNPSVNVTCSPQGIWIPTTFPSCKRRCPRLPNYRVIVIYDDPRRIQGTTAKFTCMGPPGTVSSAGDRTTLATCKGDGTWDMNPQCFRSCPEVKGADSTVQTDYSDPSMRKHGSKLTIRKTAVGFLYGIKPEVTVLTCSDGWWGKLPSYASTITADSCPVLFFDNAAALCSSKSTPGRASNSSLEAAVGSDFAQLDPSEIARIKASLGNAQPCPKAIFLRCLDRSTHDFGGENTTECVKAADGRRSWANLQKMDHCYKHCDSLDIPGVSNISFAHPNGKSIGSRMIHGTTATVSCLPDYQLIGSAVLSCYDGDWDMKPLCLPQCPPVKKPSEGYVRLMPLWANATNKRYPGIVAVYTCYRDENGKNYTLSNYNTDRICQMNGTWDTGEPLCYIQCPHVVPRYGVVKYNDARRKNETKAVYNCTEPDYWLVGDYVTHCITTTGKWDYFRGIAPRCVHIPPRIQQLIAAMRLEESKNDTESLNAALEDARRFLVPAVPPASLVSIGYQMDDFVRSCTFAKEPCKPEDWTQSMDPTLGNCFTFNGNISDDMYFVKNAGANHGLELVLYTDQQDYMRSTAKAGVAIIISAQNETVLADVDALMAPMGYQTAFSLAYHQLLKLPPPYNNCTLNGEGLVFYFRTAYSLDGCINSCMQSLLVNACYCGDPRLPLPVNESSCGVEDRDCVNEVMAWADDPYLKANCLCPPPCSQSYFDFYISKTKWPSSAYVEQRCALQREIDYEQCVYTFRKNYAKINVYYQRTSAVIQEETPSITQEIMLSDVGSYIGLWMSFSFVSAFEFVSIFIECVQRCRGKRRSRSLCD